MDLVKRGVTFWIARRSFLMQLYLTILLSTQLFVQVEHRIKKIQMEVVDVFDPLK